MMATLLNSEVCMMLAIVLMSYVQTTTTTSTRVKTPTTVLTMEPKSTIAPNPTAVALNTTHLTPTTSNTTAAPVTTVSTTWTHQNVTATTTVIKTRTLLPSSQQMTTSLITSTQIQSLPTTEVLTTSYQTTSSPTMSTPIPTSVGVPTTIAATTPERPLDSNINPPTTPINYCAGDPCKHGANCTSGPTTFLCACTPGYEGVQCEAEINFCAESYACFDGTFVFGDCVDFFNGYNCTCYPGFTNVDAQHCEDIDECVSRPCLNNGTCINGLNRFKCDCPEGKIGINCNQEKPDYTPQILTISKDFGLLAGAARLGLTGLNLAIANTSVAGAYFIPYNKTLATLYAYSNVSECDANKITIFSPRAPNDDYAGETFSIQVEYDGGYRINTGTLTYTYVGNPSVSDINPKTPFATGGVSLTVTGDNINAVSEPIMIVTVIITNTSDPGPPDKRVSNQLCSSKDASKMICLLPVIDLPKEFTTPSIETGNSTTQRRRRDLRDYPFGVKDFHIPLPYSWQMMDFDHLNRSHKSRRQRSPTAVLNSSDPHVTMALFLGFKLDGFPKYDNISKSLPNIKMTLTFTKPEFKALSIDKVQTFASGETLKIVGTNLATGCTKDDYLITIGVGICEIRTNISDNLIECYPPTTEPALGNDTFCVGTLAVLVTIAQQTNFVYCVRYPPVWTFFMSVDSTKLLVGLCIGLAFVPLIIAVVIIVCRQLRTRNTAEPDNRNRNIYSDNVIIPDSDLEPRYVVMADATLFSDSAIIPSSHQSRGFGPVIRGMPTGYPVNQSFENQSYGPELNFDSTSDVSPASTISREKRGFKTDGQGQPIDKEFRLPRKGYLKHLLNQEIPVDFDTHNQ